MKRLSIERELGALAILLISIVFFWLNFKIGIFSDLQRHLEVLQIFLKHNSFPSPPLYYYFVYGVGAIFSNNYAKSIILILTFVTVFKYYITSYYFSKSGEFSKKNIAFFAFSLMFFFPLYLAPLEVGNWYLGKFTPNVWHNSTSIFVFPLNLLLFFFSLHYIEEKKRSYLIAILALIVFIVLTKPSFLFPFCIAFPLIYFLRNKSFDKGFAIAIAASIFIFLSIFIQKKLIYQNDNLLDKLLYNGVKADIVIKPLSLWLFFSCKPLTDLFTSFCFAGVFILFFAKRLFNDWHFIYALILSAVSISIFLIFAETGPRFYHGNFYWQIPITLFILHMVLAKHLLSMISAIGPNKMVFTSKHWPLKVLIVIWLLHFIAGGSYLIHVISNKSFA